MGPKDFLWINSQTQIYLWVALEMYPLMHLSKISCCGASPSYKKRLVCCNWRLWTVSSAECQAPNWRAYLFQLLQRSSHGFGNELENVLIPYIHSQRRYCFITDLRGPGNYKISITMEGSPSRGLSIQVDFLSPINVGIWPNIQLGD